MEIPIVLNSWHVGGANLCESGRCVCKNRKKWAVHGLESINSFYTNTFFCVLKLKQEIKQEIDNQAKLHLIKFAWSFAYCELDIDHVSQFIQNQVMRAFPLPLI